MSDEVRAANEEAMRAMAADYQAVFGTPQGKRVLNHIFTSILLTDVKMTQRSVDWALYMGALHDVAVDLCRMLNLTFDQRRPKVTERPRFTNRAHT